MIRNTNTPHQVPKLILFSNGQQDVQCIAKCAHPTRKFHLLFLRRVVHHHSTMHKHYLPPPIKSSGYSASLACPKPATIHNQNKEINHPPPKLQDILVVEK